jgi:hypothetical protein
MEDLLDQPDPDISLVTIHNERELAKWNVDELAIQLTDKPVPRMFPIYLVFHNGQIKGFFQAVTQTVIYPAIHPEVMGAKEYVKIMRNLISEIKRAFGNPIFMVCARAEKMSAPALKKMRVKKAEENAYVYDDQG